MASNKRKYESDQIYHISTEWIIKSDEINKLDEGQTVSDITKPVPNLESVKYYLKFYPDWLKKCRIYLYLEMEENLNIIVNAKLTCKSANFIDRWTHIYNKSDSYGLKLCLSEELFDAEKKFVVDNQICISFEATLTIFDIQDFPFKKSKIQIPLGPKLWENESSKDVKIFVEGKDIQIHKCVVEARSTIFESFCKTEPGMPISTPKINIDEAFINHYKFDTVEKAVMFCYDIPCLDKLSAEDAVDLLKFAQEYQMKDLKENMEELCIKHLSISNACLFANSSIITEAEKLYQKCFDFLLKCMKDGTAVKDIEKLNEGMQKELFVKAFNAS